MLCLFLFVISHSLKWKTSKFKISFDVFTEGNLPSPVGTSEHQDGKDASFLPSILLSTLSLTLSRQDLSPWDLVIFNSSI